MQLFITEYTKKNSSIIVSDAELLSQLRKVLRTNLGDIVRVQSPKQENNKTRYEIRIDVRDKNMFEGTIVSQQIHNFPQEQRSMIIAMPNKRDKVELIVQKLTECGLDQIIFRPSERSILKEWNPKKEERLNKIIKEAVEQSRGWKLPELLFTTSPKDIIKNYPLIIFDKQTNDSKIEKSDHIFGLIGPEGGFTSRDYLQFETTDPKIVSLGETVLRTETAAIVGGRHIKNNIKF